MSVSRQKLKNKRLELAATLGASFEYQQNVIACPDKFRTVVKPRQAGMTTCFAIETLIDSIIYDNYVSIIISPTKRQSARMMRYIKKAFRLLERKLGYLIKTEKFTTEEIYFHWGSEIHSLPNNPLGAQGIDCDNGVIDEAGLFPLNDGEQIIDAVVGSLAAKGGRLTVSGRPRGKRGLLWQYWDENNPKYNPFTHFRIVWEDRAKEDPVYAAEVADHKRILTKLQFDEIYNAMFIDEGVLIFPHDLLTSSQSLWNSRGFVVMQPDGEPDDANPKYMGIDFGRKRSLTEIHVLQKEGDGLLRTLSMKSLENVNFEEQKRCIDDMIRRFRPIKCRVDERGLGLPLLDYLVAKHGSMVEPLKLTEGKSKEKVILRTKNCFLDLKIAIPEHDGLYEQMHCYQVEFTDKGNPQYSGKVDETDFQDDKVIALCAAVDAAQSTPFAFEII